MHGITTKKTTIKKYIKIDIGIRIHKQMLNQGI
jgi:hypothetical protein